MRRGYRLDAPGDPRVLAQDDACRPDHVRGPRETGAGPPGEILLSLRTLCVPGS